MWIIFVVFGLLFLSAIFSGSETGLTAASRAKLHRMKSDGNKRAEKVLRLRARKEQLIGTILLGNNAFNIAASALATSWAIATFAQDPDDADKVVFFVTVALTLLVLIFAEVLPKTYAFRNAEKVALWVAPLFLPIVAVFSPITRLIQVLVDSVLRLFGVSVEDDDALSDSAEFIRGAIELHHDEGGVVKDDKDMLGGILDLNDVEVEEVMLHRKSMQTINIEDPIEDVMNEVFSSRFTRIPLWRDNPDNIVGILHSKHLIRALHEQKGEVGAIKLEDLMLEPWFVPESTSLKEQLHAFREKKMHFALVVDEYGDLLGLITLEDILEEVVGQIDDEQDVTKRQVRQIPDGSYLVSGLASIRDVNRELEWSLPDDEATTIAGLVIHEAKLIPDVGQVFHFYDYRFEIMRKKRNQVTFLKVRALTDEEQLA